MDENGLRGREGGRESEHSLEAFCQLGQLRPDSLRAIKILLLHCGCIRTELRRDYPRQTK